MNWLYMISYEKLQNEFITDDAQWATINKKYALLLGSKNENLDCHLSKKYFVHLFDSKLPTCDHDDDHDKCFKHLQLQNHFELLVVWQDYVFWNVFVLSIVELPSQRLAIY